MEKLLPLRGRLRRLHHSAGEITFTMQGQDLEIGRADPVQESDKRLQQSENPAQETAKRLNNRVENEPTHGDPFTQVIGPVMGGLRYGREKFYTPEVACIGPLHTNNANVQEFEREKKHYVNNVLKPSSDLIELCKQEVQKSLANIKASYSGVDFDDDAKTCDMIVNDALFILAFCKKCLETDDASHMQSMFRVETIKHDLCLVENQIPLFILDEIFQCIQSTLNTSFIKLLSPILTFNNPFEEELTLDNVSITDAPHILGILHLCCKPCSTVTSHGPNSKIYSAVKLDKAGVKFKPKKKSQSLMGMEVKVATLRRATVELPKLCLDGRNESVIRNLIAFEQQYVSIRYFTAYVHAMTMLLNTQEDIAKLVDSGIIIKHTHSNKQAANMFKDMVRNIKVVDSYEEMKWKALNDYYNGYCCGCCWKSCFSTPWSRISKVILLITFAGAMFTFAFTVFTFIKLLTK